MRGHDLITHDPVVQRWPGVPLNRCSENIRKALIQSICFAPVQLPRILHHTMCDLMTAHIQARHFGKPLCHVAIAVGHALPVPESIYKIHIKMYIAQQLIAIVIDAVPVEAAMVKIVGHFRAPVSIGSNPVGVMV
ncbi:UNKNOWN [Stylonychia lemnae]|uniref:Uncharacterized protein n=1 Tax=Stylonychia lemnae TaxID=5949 RepID=A0A078AS84_STYLE|nr:UNKNOWN [Stylonychia lemnae]|eukprot:CDW84067.1 UNKNOWN [Stylonychia lemnae]